MILLLRSFSPNWQHQALILKGLLWWMGSSNTRSKYALLKILHCRLSQITAYHSSAFVGCSGVQATLKLRICYATSASPSQWCSWLSLVQFWYSTCYHTSLFYTPHKALYGTDPVCHFLPSELVTGGAGDDEASTLLQDHQLFSDMLQQQLSKAKNRMKHYAGVSSGRSSVFEVLTYDQKSVASALPKLAFKYFGPFPSCFALGKWHTNCRLPGDSFIHPVFHVSQLKQFVPAHVPIFSQLPSPFQQHIRELEPSAILNCCLVKKGNTVHTQVLVRWGEMPSACATWKITMICKLVFCHRLKGVAMSHHRVCYRWKNQGLELEVGDDGKVGNGNAYPEEGIV